MRPIILALSIAIAASATAADNKLLGPEDYLQITIDSKLHYNMIQQPAKTPIEELNCPRRDESTRVVMNGKEKKLVAWQPKAEAVKLLNEGEELWQKNDYAAASQKYKAAIDADPDVAAGYFFYGDALLFGADDSSAALVQYRKGIALDPTLPSGHFFAHRALVRLGRYDDAREEVIKALTYYPGYEVIWKLADKPEQWNAKPVVRHRFDVPAGLLGKRQGDSIDIWAGPDFKFMTYAICKAVWTNEPQFAKRHVPQGWSNDEERACVASWLMGELNRAKGKPEAMPPLAQHLYDVTQNHLLDGYIFFEIIGQHCPLGLATLDDASRDQIEQYIRKYVIVPAKP